MGTASADNFISHSPTWQSICCQNVLGRNLLGFLVGLWPADGLIGRVAHERPDCIDALPDAHKRRIMGQRLQRVSCDFAAYECTT